MYDCGSHPRENSILAFCSSLQTAYLPLTGCLASFLPISLKNCCLQPLTLCVFKLISRVYLSSSATCAVFFVKEDEHLVKRLRNLLLMGFVIQTLSIIKKDTDKDSTKETNKANTHTESLIILNK